MTITFAPTPASMTSTVPRANTAKSRRLRHSRASGAVGADDRSWSSSLASSNTAESRRSTMFTGSDPASGEFTTSSYHHRAKHSISSQHPQYSNKSQGSSSSRNISGSLTALTPNQRKRNSLSGFTINKLSFGKLGLYGREKEVVILENALDRLVLSSTASSMAAPSVPETMASVDEVERQLILIAGPSGTGKTKLAHALRKPTIKAEGLFVSGKFDIHCRNEPYSGIASACTEICGTILELTAQESQSASLLCQTLKDELGSELNLLIQVIPALAEALKLKTTAPEKEPMASEAALPKEDQSKSITNNSLPPSSASSKESKYQFNYAFMRFVRILCKEFSPLVMVLDDLQWADAPSLDLLQVLLTDRGNSKLLVVGIYRSNEVDETHKLHQALEELRRKSQQEKYFASHEIVIGNLEVDAVHRILQSLLRSDNSQIIGLAQICHKKTLGNAFFVLQFLSMLHERQLLQFNFGTLSWTWDEHEIELCTKATENVVDILKAKMTDLPSFLADILKAAAYLGATFELRTLKVVWENLPNESSKAKSVAEQAQNQGMESDAPAKDDDRDLILEEGLEELENEGLIERTTSCSGLSSDSYGWTHDSIQEAAMALVSEAERPSYGRQIGLILVKKLDQTELDSAIFVVVNLMNEESENITNPECRLALARLNCQACQKAIATSAFQSAAEYAEKGIHLLPANAWTDHYQLSLQLYSTGAKAESFVGNIETAENYCNQVFSQQDRPLEDKFDAYISWIWNIINRGNPAKAEAILIDILGKFNCRFPRNAASVGFGLIGNVVRVKATLKSRDASELSVMTDTQRILLMKLVDLLGVCWYIQGDARMALAVFRNLNWTMKYGYAEFSPVAFASTGIILTGVCDDLQGGASYGEQALMLLNKMKTTATTARTMFCVYSFVFAWTKPTSELLKPFLTTYDIGLQTGDTESAAGSVLFWLVMRHLGGSPIESLEADAKLYSIQMQDLKRDMSLYMAKLMRQVFLNLMGRNNVDDPTNIIGEAFTSEDFQHCQNLPLLQAGLRAYKGILMTYFGQHVEYADLTLKWGVDRFAKYHCASPCIMWETLMKGVSFFSAARQTGQRKYVRAAKKLRTKIKKWLDMGCPSIGQYDSLLEAEALALAGKRFAAIQQYKVAVLLSARGGYQQDAALASERLGEYHLHVMNDREEARYRFEQAESFWRSWGAEAKAQDLINKYPDLAPKPGEVYTIAGGASEALSSETDSGRKNPSSGSMNLP